MDSNFITSTISTVERMTMEIFNYKFMTTEGKSFVNYSVLFVLAELNVDAILQYLKTVLNRGPKWSAIDIVRLCIN